MSQQSFQAFRLHAPLMTQTDPQTSSNDMPRPGARLERITLADLSDGDTVIRVAYAGLNYKDALAYAGQGRIVRHYPRVGGIDLTGTVVSSEHASLAPGQPVIVHGFGIGVDADGGYAEYARVPHEWVLPLPAGLSLLEGCALGAAGYTAGLSLHWMEHCGLGPGDAEVLVTGASGGVGSIAVDMFSRRGYRVCAMSGKADSRDFLLALGASEVILPPTSGPVKALESARWAGVVDSVGGHVLAHALAAIKPDGCAAVFGNVGGAQLDTTVIPFILRGVKLLGINANSAMPLRKEVWNKIAGEYRPAHLDDIAHVITLAQLPEALDAMLARQSRARTVVQFSPA